MTHQPGDWDTVAFLFTDIEGSTRLWEADRDGMAVALRAHDEILRAAIEIRAGSVFKTVGDAFCAAFRNADDAVAAAADVQRRLAGAAWPPGVPVRVRAGVHVGLAERRDDDYFGPTLSRVARLMSVAHGGQTLLSAACRELVADAVPEGTALRDLGSHQLKDLQRPERVWELRVDGLDAEFPALRSLGALPNNLPAQLTSFVGREGPMAAARKLVEQSRLVSLVGVGGGGKTRLSIQLAAELLGSLVDEAWFVDLSPIVDPAHVPDTALAAARIVPQPGVSAASTLAAGLLGRRALVVLDNCEHLVDAAARLADLLLRTCPDVRVVATSRQALGVAGEAVYRIPPMDAPAEGAELPLGRLEDYGAVGLFLDRARLAMPEFRVTESSARAIARLCARLDGIPLAIELAAARVRAMPVETILSRLDDRYRLLTGGSRAAMPRQQTLQALVDWSHDLLDPGERALLRRLAVFQGGAREPAILAVCGQGEDEWDVRDRLHALLEKSLVAFSEATERFTMLETIRQYAAQRLAESGEAEEMARRHAGHFSEWLATERGGRNVQATATAAEYDKMAEEIDNLRAMMEWIIRHPEFDAWAAFAPMNFFWSRRGRQTEGIEWERRLLESRKTEPPDTFWLDASIYSAVTYTFDDQLEVAKSMMSDAAERALDLGYDRVFLRAQYNLIYLAGTLGDVDAANRLTERAVAHGKAVPGYPVHQFLHNQALALYLARRYEDAYTLLSKVEGEIEGLENLSEAQLLRGVAQWRRGEGAAATALTEALRTAEESGAAYCRILVAISLADLLAEDHPEVAARFVGYAREICRATATLPPPVTRPFLDQVQDSLTESYGEAIAEGRTMRPEEAVELLNTLLRG